MRLSTPLLAGLLSLCLLPAVASPLNLNLDRSTLRPLTGNNSQPSDWRVDAGMTFNGEAFNGVARLLYETAAGDTFVCSGSLLAGGYYVLTAAHCADNFTRMRVDFGIKNNVPLERRWASGSVVFPEWTGALSYGTDIALIRLDQQVTTIQGFKLSTENDLGKDFLIMGYGTTGQGNDPSTDTNWDDWGWAHWGTNTADVDNITFNAALGDPTVSKYLEYVADYDDPQKGDYNSLQWLADLTGNAWSSGIGTGDTEALIAGGDSGGGDFVWNGSEWLLSGVHSWGWDIVGCDNADRWTCNSAGWGDLSGSTAVFSHLAWIQANAVPAPASWLIALTGLFGIGALRRRSRA